MKRWAIVPWAGPWRFRPAPPLGLLAVLVGGPMLLAAGSPAAARPTETCLHIARFCLAALVHVDGLLHAAPLALLGAGLVRAVLRRVRRGHTAWRLFRVLLHRPPVPGEVIHRLAERHGLQDRVRVIESPRPNPAFTAGLFRPRVYLAAPLQRDLSEREIEAVLLHEAHHCAARDPLRSTLVSLLADILFWLPLVRAAAVRVHARAEIAADDAARQNSDDLTLASAILKVARITQGGHIPAPALAAPELLERRVERLLGSPSAERLPTPARSTVVLSMTALAALWAVGIVSSAAHAAHLSDRDGYCPHQHEHGVLHAGSSVVMAEVSRR